MKVGHRVPLPHPDRADWGHLDAVVPPDRPDVVASTQQLREWAAVEAVLAGGPRPSCGHGFVAEHSGVIGRLTGRTSLRRASAGQR